MKTIVDTIFKQSLDIQEQVVIERSRKGKTDKNNRSNTTRKVVWRILSYKDKVKILRNAKKLKGRNIFINEDFCQATLDHRKGVGKEAQRSREEGKIVYLQHKSFAVKKKNNTGQCLVKTTYMKN